MPEPTKGRRGDGRVRFLANLDKVKSRLSQGYSKQTIYDDLNDELAISYAQFTRYIKKFVEPELDQTNDDNNQAKTEPIQEPAREAADTRTSSRKQPFAYDPEAGKKRDDLI